VSESASALSVDSATGIEVSLPVAGPGVRAYAFLIDWHIRLVLGLAWFGAAYLLYDGNLSFRPPADNDPRWFGGVLAPALAIFLLYHFVLELAMHGRTPGKRMAGVRIVARDGGVPGAGALLTRNVFRLLDNLPMFYGVGIISVIATAQHVRVGDMAAGTLLVYEDNAPAPGLIAPSDARNRLAPEDSEIATELLQRWHSLAPEARGELARTLLTRSGVEPVPLSRLADTELQQKLQLLLGGPLR
jgi:uncharacterized RDD family membrane protein YckC